MSRFTYIASRYIAPAATKDAGLRLVFDIEADGLLDDATKAHCIVIADLDGDAVSAYGPEQIAAALEHLTRADYLAGHNICGYDLPLLRRLHNWAPASGCTIVDTLVVSRLILPNLDDLDDKAAAMGDLALRKLRGRYSLEAWGARLGIAKIGTDIEDWSKWTPEMQERCAGDVAICKVLWKFLQPDGYSQQAIELEHRVAAICNQITTDGVPFDVEAAKQLRQKWTVRRAELEVPLSQQFPGTNLNSRAQIGALLEQRGWVPAKRTKKTKQPKIDDELLETIPTLYPEFIGLAEHYTLGRRLGQLANGDKAWLKHIGKGERIHGAIVHIGTPHSRAAHSNPNLAQVPNPKRGKPFAIECRALFCHPGDWVFVACDQAGLQDRCFSHYLASFDGGAYGRSFIAGADTHWKSAVALELVSPNTERDKTSKLHTTLREGSKSFRYGFLFGMRAKRAGEIITAIVRAARQIDPSYRGPSTNGAQALRRFEAATPGLKQLREKLEEKAAQKQWVLGLDKRRVPTGAQYKALNRIVTSAEAIVCKRWLIRVYDELCARFRYGWDGDVVITAWVHDELAVCCRPEIAEQVGETMVRHAREPSEFYGLKVPLDAEYKIGRSWAGDAQENDHTPAETDLGGHDQPEFDGKHGDALDDILGDSAEPVGHPGSGQSEITHPQPFISVESEAEHCAPVEKTSDSGNSGAGHKILCPFHDDHTPSLQIYSDGHYHCYACGAHGDVEELSEQVPVPTAPPAPQTDTLERGMRLWQAVTSIRGTLAERYLVETRKLDLAIVPDLDAALRFHQKCPFDGNAHPCLIALFRDVETDEAAGIHRVALTADAKKIGRMMLGSWPRSRAIKLRPAGEDLLIGEGIETSIAGEMKLRWRSALWALGSAGAIGQLPPIAGVTKLGILVDREDSGIGAEAGHRCATRWQYAKRKVVLLTPRQADTDFNDIVKGKGA
jgi:DNA polymerase-1